MKKMHWEKDEGKKTLFAWNKIKQNSKILYIGTEEDTYSFPLKECNQIIYSSRAEFLNEEWRRLYYGYFDYVISVKDIEQTEHPIQVLKYFREVLNINGKLLLAVNNRLGVRYFCGDRDPYSERSFDGIENYRRFYMKKQDTFLGRMYDKDTLRKMLSASGWKADEIQFYSIFSDLDNPVLIYSEEYTPKEDLSTRVFPTYNSPDTVFLEEEGLYEGLINNQMFHQMANAYLIECAMDGNLSDVLHVTNSVERGQEDALFTIIYKSGIVEKKAIYTEGKKRIWELEKNCQDLMLHGIAVVEGVVKNDVYRMPYVKEKNAQVYLKELIKKDKNLFLEKLDIFKEAIIHSSKIVVEDKGDGNGIVLQKGYLDMVPLNSFYIQDQYVFFDQEFCVENCPANVILYRMIGSFFSGNEDLEQYITRKELYDRYHLSKKLEKWEMMSYEFISKLRKEKEHRVYHEQCRRNMQIVNENRQKINYANNEYKKLFENIFEDLDKKKLILFGAGTYAKQFIAIYGTEYKIEKILDNNQNNCGNQIGDIVVESPEVLTNLNRDDYKIIVCVKSYLSILKQLKEMQFENIGIYNPGKTYKREKQPIRNEKVLEERKKPYHIGYVAGVFDMFHVGHINLLRKAKDQCDYLIVGVVPDEDVYKLKKKYPIISCEDRVEVLKSCKYTDQVEALPVGHGSIREAYQKYQFDVQFSGDDHGADGNWLADKLYLEKQGAQIVFFSYTEKVSSSKLREYLE